MANYQANAEPLLRGIFDEQDKKTMSLLTTLSRTTAPAAVVLIRLMVGGVFLSEGIQKFLFADDVGAGRFARIGIPSPEMMGPFVGVVEIVCGALILLGFLTRLAAIALLIDILVAIFSTKVPFFSVMASYAST